MAASGIRAWVDQAEKEHARLQDRLREMQNVLEEQQAENGTLQARLEELLADFTHNTKLLQERDHLLDEAHQVCSALRDMLDGKDMEISELQAALDRAQNESRLQREIADDLKRCKSRVTEEVERRVAVERKKWQASVRKRVAAVETENDELRAQIVSLREQLELERHESNSRCEQRLQESLGQLRANLRQAKDRATTLEAKERLASKETGMLQQRIDQLVQQRDTAYQQVDRIEEKARGLELELETARRGADQRAEELEWEIGQARQAANAEHAGLRAQLEAADQRLQQCEERHEKRFQESLKRAEALAAQLKQEQERRSVAEAELLSRQEQHQVDVDKFSRERGRLEGIITQLKDRISMTENEMQTGTRARDAALDNATQKVEELEAAIRYERQETARIGDALRAAEATVERLRKDLQTKESQVHQAVEDALANKERTHKKEMAKAHDRLQEDHEELSRCRDILTKLQLERDDAIRIVAAYKHQLRAFLPNLSSRDPAGEAHDVLNDPVTALHEELERERRQNANLRRALQDAGVNDTQQSSSTRQRSPMQARVVELQGVVERLQAQLRLAAAERLGLENRLDDEERRVVQRDDSLVAKEQEIRQLRSQSIAQQDSLLNHLKQAQAYIMSVEADRDATRAELEALASLLGSHAERLVELTRLLDAFPFVDGGDEGFATTITLQETQRRRIEQLRAEIYQLVNELLAAVRQQRQQRLQRQQYQRMDAPTTWREKQLENAVEALTSQLMSYGRSHVENAGPAKLQHPGAVSRNQQAAVEESWDRARSSTSEMSSSKSTSSKSVDGQFPREKEGNGAVNDGVAVEEEANLRRPDTRASFLSSIQESDLSDVWGLLEDRPLHLQPTPLPPGGADVDDGVDSGQPDISDGGVCTSEQGSAIFHEIVSA